MRILAAGVMLVVLGAYLIYLEGRYQLRARRRHPRVSEDWLRAQERRSRTETPNAWRLHRGGHWRS